MSLLKPWWVAEGSMLFGEYVCDWKVNARLKISEGWKMCQDQIIRDHIMPYLKDMELSEINSKNISRIIQHSVDKGHSPRQTKKIYMVLSKLFNDANHFFEYIQKNPVKKYFHKPEIPDNERPTLTPEQSLVLLEYVYDQYPYGLAIWIQALAGLRVSEIQALDWSDIDLENNFIYVKRAFNKITMKVQKYTKNKTQYRVPICPMLRRYLMKHLRKDSLVCRSQTGNMMSYRGYQQYLKKVIKKLNLPIHGTHGLRHACATLYAFNGASDEDIQKLLGHRWLVSTKTYIHRTDENLFKISLKIC